jgi:hypothetical protein
VKKISFLAGDQIAARQPERDPVERPPRARAEGKEESRERKVVARCSREPRSRKERQICVRAKPLVNATSEEASRLVLRP